MVRLTSGRSSVGNVTSVLVTGLALLAVFVALGLVVKVVYDALPQAIAFPGLLAALAVLGFGGLYVVLQVGDWPR